MLSPDQLEETLRLHQEGMAIRAIARRLGLNVKTVRKALQRPGKKPTPSKLGRFRDLVRERVQKGLAVDRILREIRERGYTGSRTILSEYVRSIRGPRKVHRKVFRRFETRAAKEAQCDWSPFRIKIGGQETVIHCFSMVLCFSRRMFVAFYRDERLPTLLFAHGEAFAYFSGCPARVQYDNQTAVSLGRIGGENLWNPTFKGFADYYGFKPRTIKPKHKERQGKVERPFPYIEGDLLRGNEFASWDDLAARTRHWLDTLANVRKHKTTGRLVHEAFLEEQPLLIQLPETPYPTDRREVRKVQKDGYLQVDGTFYPAPARLVGQYVTVRIYPTRVEILDAAGQAAATHKVPDRQMRLPADWGPPVDSDAAVSSSALETYFLAWFPQGADFLEGLRRRMTTLTPIHLRQIQRLVSVFGQARVALAIERAQHYRNFSALAIARILEQAHPNVVPEPEVGTVNPAAMGALDDVESGTPEDYPF